MTVPVPGPPAAVLAAIIRQDPAHPYNAADPRQRRYAYLSTTGSPVLPSLVTEQVFMPQFALLDAYIQATGSLSTQGLPGAAASSRYAGATASGPPSSGTFAAGDFVIDQSGAIWICTAAGSPGSWASPAGLSNPMNAPGDLIVGGTSGAPARLGIGTNGQVLGVTAGTVAWINNPAGFVSPMTTAGDTIIAGTGGAAQRLGIGAAGQVLTVVANAPAWTSQPSTVLAPSGNSSGAPDVAAITAANNALVNAAQPGGVVVLAPGQWWLNGVPSLSAQSTAGNAGGFPVCLQGSGPATVINIVGTGGISYHRTSGYGQQYGLSAQKHAGFIRDLVIDMTNAGIGATGLDVGDGWGLDVSNVAVVNATTSQNWSCTAANPGVFTWGAPLPSGFPVFLAGTMPSTSPAGQITAGQIYYVVSPSGSTSSLAAYPNGPGIQTTSTGSGTANGVIPWRITNRVSWTEKGRFQIDSQNCAVAGILDSLLPANPPDKSHEFNEFDFRIFSNTGQQGIVCGAGVNINGRLFHLQGNMSVTSSTGSQAPPNNVAALSFMGTNGLGAGSRLYQATLRMRVEGNSGNGSGTVFPYGLYSDGNGYLREVDGHISHSLGNPNVNGKDSVWNGAEFSFTGPLTGDSYLTLLAPGAPGGQSTITTNPPFPGFGVTQQNYGPDQLVCVAGGGTTGIVVNGGTTGLSSGSFYVRAGGTITVNGSGASPSAYNWVPASSSTN